MLDVIFTICLLADPKNCETLRAETQLDDNHFIQCVMNAQQVLSQYVTKDRYVKAFGCRRRDSKDG